MFIHPDGTAKLSCYIGSDFGGLFGSATHKGLQAMNLNCPFSTVEAEHIDLSLSMKDPIPTQEMFKETHSKVLKKDLTLLCSAHSKARDETVV